ncbi:uncharacterized protein LOC118737810 [Rhagoletis pomonella]|uniref:uncharacterized protein LOC118737810 n=1 Tax=Rhagoletis pomonella TaxID=28610 RepID=UPI0017818D0B|nr:uncharacterized protein LOC118737810 [Rhagoletis pomonella]
MAEGDNSTNGLYDLIRKEMNSIINEIGEESKNMNATCSTRLETEGDADQQQEQPIHNSEKITTSDNIPLTGTTDTKIKKEHLPTLLSTKLLQLPREETQSAAIDTDLQNMRCDLQQSYELFLTMGERFQAINFSSLKTRIKDMHLAKKDRTVSLEDEIKEILQIHYRNNTLDKLTVEMGEKFQRHPGEFGNIPELSEFFQTCTQLQHGLEQLKRQRHSVDEMAKRLSRATEISYARIDDINKTMMSRQPGQDSELKN